jgi:hypothetical protein
VIAIGDIGEGDDALLCFTDLRECCQKGQSFNNSVVGDWVYPNGIAVGIKIRHQGFYKNRNHSVVRLNRRENITAPTGKFCCEVLDATHQMVIVCINVNEHNFSSSMTTYYGDDLTSMNPTITEGQAHPINFIQMYQRYPQL